MEGGLCHLYFYPEDILRVSWKVIHMEITLFYLSEARMGLLIYLISRIMRMGVPRKVGTVIFQGSGFSWVDWMYRWVSIDSRVCGVSKTHAVADLEVWVSKLWVRGCGSRISTSLPLSQPANQLLRLTHWPVVCIGLLVVCPVYLPYIPGVSWHVRPAHLPG